MSATSSQLATQGSQGVGVGIDTAQAIDIHRGAAAGQRQLGKVGLVVSGGRRI